MEDLNLVVNEERLKSVDLETFYGLDSSPRAQMDFVAHFMMNGDGKYLPKAEAVKKLLKGRTLSDLEAISNELQEKMNDAAVPKG